MIIAIIGNVGSGKSLSAVKKILESKYPSFCNFQLHNNKAIRIKRADIVENKKVNWKFWNEARKKYKNYHIILDEIHNIVNARRSMTINNVLMGEWMSQIRKVLGNKENTNIIFLSQRIKKVDSAFRDLLHEIIYCEKIEMKEINYLKDKITGEIKQVICKKLIPTIVVEENQLITKHLPETWIVQHHFFGENCLEKYHAFREGQKTYDYRKGFIGNNFFKFFDSYEIFGETAYL